jgi:hypothetical protein
MEMQYQNDLMKIANSYQMTYKDFLKFLEAPDRVKTGAAKRRWKKERAK